MTETLYWVCITDDRSVSWVVQMVIDATETITGWTDSIGTPPYKRLKLPRSKAYALRDVLQTAGHKASCVIADETPLKLPRIPIPGESNILDAIDEVKNLLERVLRRLEGM